MSLPVPGEAGVPARPDDELAAPALADVVPVEAAAGADGGTPQLADGEQAQVNAAAAALLAETHARTEAWKMPFHYAALVGATAVREYGVRHKAAKGASATEVDEDTGGMVSDAELRLRALQPSTVLVDVARNDLTTSPASWMARFMSYAGETPRAFGWTVAEMQQLPESDDSSTPVTGGEGEIDGLLAQINGRGGETTGEDDEDDALIYDEDAVVERIIVVNGAKNALLLVTGTRGELDKATPTRVAFPKADKEDKDGKDRAKLDAYIARNDFSKVEVRVITPKAIAEGKAGLRDTVAMGNLVAGGLEKLIRRMKPDAAPAASEA